MHAPATTALDNRLLASLPRNDFNLLAPHLTTISLPHNTVIFEVGDEVDQVYFPHNGMIARLTVMRDGKAIGTATVGQEGMVGGMAGLRPYRSVVRVITQLPTIASRIAAPELRKAVAESDALQKLCIDYNEVLLTQTRITAACNALHPLEARFCRWLLRSADRAASDTVELTQELLAEMLGVRRTSITKIACKIQDQGIITYSRGVIRISDRASLERLSCECYRTLLEPTLT
jgi:CRP-like cAMP-binding protein